MLIEIKMPFLIVAAHPMQWDDGAYGTDIVIKTEDLKKLPEKLVLWDGSQKDIPKRLANAEGTLAHEFAGYGQQETPGDYIQVHLDGLRIYRVSPMGDVTSAQVEADDWSRVNALDATAQASIAEWDSSKGGIVPTKYNGVVYTSEHKQYPITTISTKAEAIVDEEIIP